MATFLKDRQFAVEGTFLYLYFKTFFLIFKRKLHWTEREKVYILCLFKVLASCYSYWNLIFPWELCVSLKHDLFTFHTSYIQGLEMNWVTSRTFFSLLEHPSFEVPAIKAFQLLSLFAVIICGFADHSQSQVLKIQIPMKMIFPTFWTHSTMASSTPMIMSFNLTSAAYSRGHAPRHCLLQFSSVQFSRSVVSDSLWPHELQHARPPCPSPTPGVYPNSVHQFGDAIQPSHPLLSPSPPAPNPFQHQSLFQ